MGPTSLRVLVAVDQPLLREALEASLASEANEYVVASSSRQNLCREATRMKPDLVLVEMTDSRDEQALSLLEGLAGRDAMRLVVLAPEDDGNVLLAALSAGAHGFVTQGMRMAQVREALDDIARGGVAIPSHMLGGLLRELIEQRRQQEKSVDRFDKLSHREREVLCLLAHGNDQTAIASSLVISPQTARTHIQNVLAKLEVHSRVEAASLALEHGLVQMAQGR
jgi:two-component system nitrate/nitrite response regulator NarL